MNDDSMRPDVSSPNEPPVERTLDSHDPVKELGDTVSFAGSTRRRTSGDQVSDDAEETARQFGDFELLVQIAAGAMGVVWKARQVALNRVVALKLIRAGEHASDEELLRFQIEAQAAGRLDHPGITPVYEMGRRNGQSYYAMGFVQGESLAQRLQRGPLEPRAAAQILFGVADALAYAHKNNVIHRDLKPGNILLDTGGEPRLTDFGLARRLDVEEQLTHTGQILGTPSYMSPEQARGDHATVGPPSDIYALGAVLYAMLTGRPPYQGASVPETLRLVHETDPVPPRRWNPAIDRDLETICLKCLEKVPAARYPSAAAVREELSRYLEGLPIVARPLNQGQRLLRWARRRPIVAGLAATILVLLMLGTAGAVRAYREVVKQRDLARESAAKAREATEETVDALKFVVFDVNHRLVELPGTEPLRQDLLQDAIPRFTAITMRLEQLPEANRSLVQSYVDTGDLQAELGQTANAAVTYRKAIEVGRRLAADHPDDYRYQIPQLLAGERLARTLGFLGETNESLALFREISTAADALPSDSPDVLGLRFSIAYNLGIFHRGQGHLDQSLACFQRSLTLATGLRELNGDLSESDVAQCHNGIAAMLLKLRFLNLSLLHALLAVEKSREQLALRNVSPVARHDLCSTLVNQGRIQHARRELVPAKQSLEESVSLIRQLRTQAPHNMEYPRLYYVSLASLGVVLGEFGDIDGARTALIESLAINRDLADADAKNIEFNFDCMVTIYHLAAIERATFHVQEVRKWLKQAQPLLDGLPKNLERAQWEHDFAALQGYCNQVDKCVSGTADLAAEQDIDVLSTAMLELAGLSELDRLATIADHLVTLPVEHDAFRYNIACGLARSARLLADPDGESDAARQRAVKAAENLNQRAIGILRDLVTSGFFANAAYEALLETDDTWDGLRSREDFRALRAPDEEPTPDAAVVIEPRNSNDAWPAPDVAPTPTVHPTPASGDS